MNTLDKLEALAPALTPKVMKMINLINKYPFISIGELSNISKTNFQTTYFHVHQLSKNTTMTPGLVRIEKCTVDKRKRMVSLTKTGEEVANLIQPLNENPLLPSVEINKNQLSLM
jgi:DNA-binding MarR family transcriptional regulator